MKLAGRNIQVSTLIVFFTIGLYGICKFLPESFTSLLPLIPGKIIYNFELWRIFTFPLAAPGIISIFFFAYVFLVITPQLEDIIKKKEFIILSVLIIALQGMLFSLIFADSGYTFSGADGLSFYYVFLYAGFRLSSKKLKKSVQPHKIGVITLLAVLLWASVIILQSGNIYSDEVFAYIPSAVYGINMGIVSYFMIQAGIIKRKRKLINQLQNIRDNEEDLHNIFEYAVSKNQYAAMKNNSSNDDILGSTSYYEFQADEDILNQILDKICVKGQESLTFNERRYLEDYSNYLK